MKHWLLKNGNKLDWLNDLSSKEAIIHSDYDGVLSMCFLQQYANLNQIVGIYDLNSIYFNKEEYLLKPSLEDVVAIDVDISYKGINYIGHHMSILNCNDKSFNINEHYKLNTDAVLKYNRKYPLNTIILLYRLFGLEPQSDEEIALVVYADSVFKNYIDYNKNVVSWLKRLNQFKILDALNNRYDKILDIIDNKIHPITSLYNDPRSKSKYSQTQLTKYKPNYYESQEKMYKGNPEKLLEMIKDITKWDKIIPLPDNMFFREVFSNKIVALGEVTETTVNKDYNKDKEMLKELYFLEKNNNYKKLQDFLEENKESIVSTSLTYKDSAKISIVPKNTEIILKNGIYIMNIYK